MRGRMEELAEQVYVQLWPSKWQFSCDGGILDRAVAGIEVDSGKKW